jgi:hypothetical protein
MRSVEDLVEMYSQLGDRISNVGECLKHDASTFLRCNTPTTVSQHTVTLWLGVI